MRGIPAFVTVWVLASAGTTSGQILQTINRPVDLHGYEGFGLVVTTDRQTIAVGSYDGCEYCSRTPGAVRLFRADGPEWAQYAKLLGSDTVPGDSFGSDLELSGDLMVAASDRHVHGDGTRGGAYVFRFDGADWVEEAELRPDDAPETFGSSASAAGDVVAVGASGYLDVFDWVPGAVYLYRFDGAQWALEQKLVHPYPEHGAGFGSTLSLSGNRLAVAADHDLYGFGAVYLYEYDGTSWKHSTKIVPDETHRGTYPWSVDLDGAALAVGSSRGWYADSNQPPVVSVYRLVGDTWTMEFRSEAPMGEDEYGRRLSIEGSRLMIGSATRATTFAFDGQEWSPFSSLGVVSMPAVAVDGTVGVIGGWDSVFVLDAAVGTDVSRQATVPTGYALSPNYPNPFNPSTTIAYDLPEAGSVRLSVYDVQGRLVDDLQAGFQAAGRYEIGFDAGNLPSGMYLYRLESGSFSEVRTMVLVR